MTFWQQSSVLGQNVREEEVLKEIFDTAQKAVVKIEAVDPHGRLEGTGFFINPSGLILTSYSVGGDTGALRVTIADHSFRMPAKRLIADSRSGLALLQIEAETPFLSLSEDALPLLDEPVVAVGYPLGGDISSQTGTIAGSNVRSTEKQFATSHLRARVPALPGLSGSPLLDQRGRVVGVVISRLEDGAGCYALPARALRKVHDDYRLYGEVRHGWVGVELSAQSPAPDATPQPIIQKLVESGAAERAGLQQGDVLLQIGEFPILAPTDIVDASFFLRAGEDVLIRVKREGQVHEMNVEVGFHPGVPRPALVSPPPMFPGHTSFELEQAQ
ncbi:MAG: S1C family serine protease [Verrucomicrobiales bacterium]